MSVLLDTGILYAYYDRSDAWHRRAVAVVQSHVRGLLVPAPVIPEVDHLLGHRLGAPAQLTFYRGFTERTYAIADLPHGQIERVAELSRRFASLKLGFVDAAVVAIAESTGLRRIATADRRHFEPLAAALSLELLP